MNINILTIIPDFYDSFLKSTIIARSVDRKLININIINIKDFSLDKNHRIDDRPISGGAGLIMRLEPIMDALKTINLNSYKILLGPKGKQYNQEKAIDLSKKEDITLICGHYEGIDYRINDYIDEEISIGDFILTGGEIASVVIVDSITRLLKGAISDESIVDESFNSSLLEYPQYTYPVNYDNKKIPDILFTGNHTIIDEYHKKEALKETMSKRRDLISTMHYDRKIATYYQEIKENKKGKLEEKIEAILIKNK